MVLKKTMPLFYGDTQVMNNKLISTIMTLSVMWIMVYYSTMDGHILDEDGLRYINKVSCEKQAKRTNAESKRDCEEHMPCKYIRALCVSARDYIPPARKK